MSPLAQAAPTKRLARAEIESRLRVCNPLPSLSRTNHSLTSLLAMEQHYTGQISDIVRHDPSLTARILQLVNSVYFGLANAVRTVDEAVFYVGVEQLRQLVLLTPIIDDLKSLVSGSPFSWRGFWQHSIATALMTREVLRTVSSQSGETDYVAGLLHDVGKIVMAAVFPGHFADVQHCVRGVVQHLREVERYILGVDHAELGGAYLASHNVPEVFVETVRHHHDPEQARNHAKITAAVQVADLLVRHAQLGSSGNPEVVSREDCYQSPGWALLFGAEPAKQSEATLTALVGFMGRLPKVLEAMV